MSECLMPPSSSKLTLCGVHFLGGRRERRLAIRESLGSGDAECSCDPVTASGADRRRRELRVRLSAMLVCVVVQHVFVKARTHAPLPALSHRTGLC